MIDGGFSAVALVAGRIAVFVASITGTAIVMSLYHDYSYSKKEKGSDFYGRHKPKAKDTSHLRRS